MSCLATHPNTGARCTKDAGHNESLHAMVRQHVAADGLKWPQLHVLDPSEGFNPPQSYRN